MSKQQTVKHQRKDNGLAAIPQHRLTINQVILILGIVAIIAIAVVAAVVLTRPKPSDNSPDNITDINSGYKPIGNLIVDEDNLAEIEREVSERVAKGRFETHMNTTWTFPDGKSASTDAVMGNSVNNNYPFWFEIVLPGTEEPIFTSSLLPVGSQLAEIKLDTPLEQGEYQATIYVHMVDENNEPVESNMGFSITLKVKN